jgi:hypothetical protein
VQRRSTSEWIEMCKAVRLKGPPFYKTEKYMDKKTVRHMFVGDSLNFSLSEVMRTLEPDLSGLTLSPQGEIINRTKQPAAELASSTPVFEAKHDIATKGS